MIISAVMNTLDLAELKGIDGQAHVTVSREPDSVMLIMNLVAIAHAALFHSTVTANLEDGRRGVLKALGHIQIRRHIQARNGLIM